MCRNENKVTRILGFPWSERDLKSLFHEEIWVASVYLKKYVFQLPFFSSVVLYFCLGMFMIFIITLFPARIFCVGAPIAGSAVDQIEQVVGYVSLGYPFGMMASILFGRHNKAILESPKPKLFVMGTKDGFTSVKQLNNKLSSAAGRAETHLIGGVSHFQMEGPAYDAQMVNLILEFIASL